VKGKEGGLIAVDLERRSDLIVSTIVAKNDWLFLGAWFDKIAPLMIVKKLSVKEAEEADLQDWRSMTPAERLDLVQLLRDLYYEFKNEGRKGFQRVYRIVKQQ
jgi:hypothetical protein